MTKPFDLDIEKLKDRSAKHAARLLAGTDDPARTGLPYLVLTTTGRKSGEPRSTPLIYGQDGDRYVIVASLGGAPDHPQWFLNLEAEPAAEVHVDGADIIVRASVAGGDERTRLWKLMASIYPLYDEYQPKTDREIPVVVLEPVA